MGDYLRRLYFGTICFRTGDPALCCGRRSVEHLMLGSDAPFPLGERTPSISFGMHCPPTS